MNVEVVASPLESTELLAEVARALVTIPEAVRVDVGEEGSIRVLWLTVASRDRHRIIGPRGRSMTALRHLFTSIGHLDGDQLLVKIRD